MNKLIKRISILSILLFAFAFINITNAFADNIAVLTFDENQIIETNVGEGYNIIDNTSLMIDKAGTYRIKGSSTNGNIEIKKGTKNVILILDNLSLESSKTAPIKIGKDGSDVTIKLLGNSRIVDNENPDNEFSEDVGISSKYEGAGIKIGGKSKLTISGNGSLEISGNANNAIRGAEEAELTINSGKIDVNSVNNGISCDGIITINGGIISVTSMGEGIQLAPDTASGLATTKLTINGGNILVNANEDGIQSTGNIYINNKANITVNSLQDAIQTKSNFYMTNGVLNLYTFGGYDTTNFVKETMSAKGIKASKSEDADNDFTNTISITGGRVNINSSDDSIHSDGRIFITRGVIDVKSHDDAIHADSVLEIGTENGLERDPIINVEHSFEGLEAANIFIYSGKIKVKADDDGINAAGGSSHDAITDVDDPNYDPLHDPNNPDNFAIYIRGGQVYVDAGGDGLDSNGSIYLTGGKIYIYPETTTDEDSALDRDGNLYISGATVFFAGGVAPSGLIDSIGSSQNYLLINDNLSEGTRVGIHDFIDNVDTLIFNDILIEDSDYTFYTSPGLTSGAHFYVLDQQEFNEKLTHSWLHNWSTGVVTTEATPSEPGVITYTSLTDNTSIERQSYFYTGELTYNIYNKTINDSAKVIIGGEEHYNNFTVHDTDGILQVETVEDILVITSSIGGEDYSRLTPIDYDNSNHIYTFNIDNSQSQDIYVVLVGDINTDGVVDNLDKEKIKNSKLSLTNTNYVELSSLEKEISDINDNGVVSVFDALLIDKLNISLNTSSTNKFELTNNGAVTLNEGEDGEVEVFFKATDDINLDAIEAHFIPNNENSNGNTYFTLKQIEKYIDETDADFIEDIDNGLIYYNNNSGVNITNGQNLYKATFTVDKSTPSGHHPISIKVESVVTHDSSVEKSFILTDHVIVKGENDPFMAAYITDEGVESIDVYYTQDYSEPSASNVTSSIVTNPDNGSPINSGSGQLNFKINLKEGYVVSGVSATGTYNQIKGPGDTLVNNLYRVTKVKSDIEVFITTKKATEFTGSFHKGTGIERVDVYYTTDYTTPSETNANIAYARDSANGMPIVNGDGQINFKVIPAYGYKLFKNSVTVDGNYKNLKEQSNGIYRITKIAGDLEIFLTAVPRTLIIPTITGIENEYTYQSGQIKPIPIVKYGDITLVEGTDYKVIYGTNINIGENAGTITIKSIDTSDYVFDDINITFDITRYNLTRSNVIAPSSIVYNGNTLSPKLDIRINEDIILVEGTDYDVVYTNLDGSIGEYITAVVTGKGNYEGTIDDISILISDKYAQTLAFAHTDVDRYYGNDYILAANHPIGNGAVTYTSSNEDVATVDNYGSVTIHKYGEAIITASAAATNDYEAATTSYNLTVKKRPLTIGEVVVSDKQFDNSNEAYVIKAELNNVAPKDVLLKGTNYTATGLFDTKYVGNDKDVSVTVTLNDDLLDKYSLFDNTYSAKATITKAEITASNVSLDQTSYTYSGASKEPVETIVINGITLVKDTDYTIKYENNINVGQGKVIINGLGSYITDGDLVIPFTINKQVINPTLAPISDQTYNKVAITPNITLTYNDNELVNGVDYDVEYSNNINKGIANVHITSKGNYSFNDINSTFNIIEHTIVDNEVTLSNTIYTYDGNAKTPNVTVKVNDTILVKDVDYVVTYQNNVEVGTNAKVIVAGNSENFNGEVTKTFEITNKNILSINTTINSSNNDITYSGDAINLDDTVTISNNPNSIKVSDLTKKYYKVSNNEEIAAPTSVGSYYVVYSYNDDNNIGSLEILFNIIKKESSIPDEVNGDLTGMKGEELSTVTLNTSGLSFKSSSALIKAGYNKYQATYTENNDNTNYTTNTVDIPVYGKNVISINTGVVGEGGTISPSVNNVVEGSKETILFTPNEGYKVDKILVNGYEADYEADGLIVVAGNTNMTVEAKFAPKTINIEVNGNNSASGNTGSQIVTYNSDNTLDVTPSSGYEIASVRVNGVERTTSVKDGKLALNGVTDDTLVEVETIKIPYVITSGDNQIYVLGSGKDVKFKVDANYSLFKTGGHVYVDNLELNSSEYRAVEGLEIILENSFVEKLEEGEHELRIEFSDGTITTTKFIVSKDSEELIASKRRIRYIYWYITTFILLVLLIIHLVTISYKKDKNKDLTD